MNVRNCKLIIVAFTNIHGYVDGASSAGSRSDAFEWPAQPPVVVDLLGYRDVTRSLLPRIPSRVLLSESRGKYKC